MKKTLLLITLLLTTCLGLSAQSLDGTWRCYQDIDDDPNGMFIYFKFAGKSDLMITFTMRIEDADIGQIDVAYDVPATYSREGNILNCQLDAKKTKMRIERVAWCRELKVQFYREPGMEEAAKAMLEEVLTAESGKLVETFSIFSQMTIIDLTAETLMLKAGTDTMTFVRFNQ